MLGVGEELRYELVCHFSNSGRSAKSLKETFFAPAETGCTFESGQETSLNRIAKRDLRVNEKLESLCQIAHSALSGVRYFRWNPRMMALPVAPDSKRMFRLNSDGFGLTLLLDDILGYDRKSFDRLEEKFVELFPQFSSIKLVPQPAFRARPDDLEQVSRLDQAEGKGIELELKNTGRLIPASQISDGTILVLGYLAVLYSPKPPRLLLIEEPENGIHTKLLRDVIDIMKKILQEQSHTQIVLTTHSPYAVDLFSPEEVTLCTKQEDGSVSLTRMSDSESVRNQISLFSLGEIWTAEGDTNLAKSTSA
jgi:hypothetical protein